MNKIFKIVWNHNIGSYTVVSELAKGKTKASSEQNNSISEAGKGRLKKQFILTALALSLGVESAWAMIPEGNASGAAAIAVGTDSKATTTQSIAIGWTAQATGATQAVAVGPDAIASGTQSTAIGNNTRATGDSSIAIGGDDWNAVRTKTIAATGKQVHQVFQELTGMEMKANGEAYKNPFKGTTSADAAVAVGVNAYAEGVLSIAVGSGASATGLGASAFGMGASASKDKSVAIGAGSNTSMDAAAITTATVNGITYNGFAGATKITAGSQVSVGRVGYERQIKHVAPGEISATSTDAINGSQLYQVASQAANPLKFDGDSGTTVERKLGSTLNVKGGATGILTDNNIGVVADKSSNTLRLKLAQNINLGATGGLQTGNTTVNNDGVAITSGPSITKTGISAGNKPITNVASGGTTDSNAANIGDVKKAAAAAKTVVKQGANTTVSSATDAATGATEYTVNAEKSVVQGSSDVTVNAATNGLTTTYTADLSTTAKASLAKADTAVQKVVSSNPNLTASKTGDTVTLDFSQTPSFTSVTTGNSKLSSDGLKIGSGANSVSLTNSGLSNGGNKITNIADGAADTDAASFKQVKAAKTEVQAGTNVASVAKTDGTNGQAIYTVNAKGAAVALDSSVDGLKLTSSEDTTTNVTTYKLDLADKTKTSLAKADSALQNIGVQVNGTNAKTLNQANSTLNFVNGTGTTAENKNGNIAFNVNKANLSVNGGTVSADKQGDEFATAKSVADAINQAVTDSEKTSVVAAGDNTHVASAVSGNQTTYTVHADKTTVSAKTGGKLNVTSVQTANGNQTKTTNYELDLTDAAKAEIAKGVEAKTAVDTQGIGFAADSGSPVTKKLGDSLNIKGDNKNITTKINDGNVQVTLNDDISVQNVNAAASVITPKVVAGDSTLTSDGLNITGGPSITKAGISAGNKPITNVASGGTTDSNAANIGDVKKAAAAAKTVVKQGANTTVSSATDAATGATEYTVNAEKSVVQGSSDVTVNAATNGLTTTYTADLSTTAKASLAKADTAVQKVVSSNPNLTASKTGDTVTLDFSQTPSFTSVTTGNSKLSSDGLKIGSGANSVSLTNSGLSNGGNKITNVAKGTADTDAVNLAQLKDAAAAASNKVESGNANIVVKPVNNADGSTTYKVATADKLTAGSFTAGNTVVNNGGVKVGSAVALGNDGLKAGNVSVGTNGINAGNHAVKNVAKGVNDTDAVNVAQLREQIAAGVKTTTVVAGKNVTVSNKVNGNNTEYTINAEKTTVSAAAGGAVKVNAGTKNADGVTDYAVDLTDAAKAEGVAAKNTVDNKGLTFNADGSTTTGIKKLGDTVAINGDGNIITKADANGIQIGLNKNLNVQSVKAGDTILNNSGVAVGGNVALTQNGLKAGNVNVSASGIDAGGNKITRVAPGVVAAGSTDAVNGGQLYAVNQAARAAKTEVVAGKNIVVTERQGANGQSVYQVATSDNLTVGSVKAGATTVNDRGISIALPTAHDPENAVSLSPDGLNNGGQRISNVAPGRVGTDAVNLNQLAGLGNALQNNIDRVGKKAYSGVAGAIAQGSIPQVTRPGATGIGVGSGYYGGQSAMAIGVSAMSDGGNWIIKGNFSANTGGHVGVGAGALYQW